ncbi:MAG TPA: protein phosphatase 2C domain-containing protein, partial [Blastocatellia bacterium]|nr:protein phosphatase 2C domain-containing protein [Blastocatellia bacterium]
AWSDFRFSFQTLVGPPPALILLSTDGYANSFVSEEAFLKVGKDLLEMARADGLEKVNANLEAWLSEASEGGSGDDVTLAVICRADALSSPDQSPPASPVEEKISGEVEAADKDSYEPSPPSPDPPAPGPPVAEQQAVAPEEEKQ